MKEHFKTIAENKKIKKESRIMEIDDGIFLQNFKNYNHLGIEPSSNVCKISKLKTQCY